MPRGRKKSTEPKEEKSYSVIEEAEVIMKKVCEKYPEVLWAVNPKEVGIFGVDNAERPASSDTLAKIRNVTGIYKALLDKHNVGVKYLIEIYWSDWNNWTMPTKQWIVFHELLHIPGPDKSGLIKHDVQDFALAVDVVGVDGYTNRENLPDLLGDKPVTFRKELLLRMQKPEQEKEDDTPTPPDA
jgi:predicted metallopeptidase